MILGRCALGAGALASVSCQGAGSGFAQAVVAALHVFNAQVGGAVTYTTQWADVVEHNGVLYGLTADALQTPDVNGAEAVAPVVVTGDLMLGTEAPKRGLDAGLGLRADGQTDCTVAVINGGRSRDVQYAIPARDADGVVRRSHRLERGMVGELYRFSISNPADGAVWELHELQVRNEPIRDRR